MKRAKNLYYKICDIENIKLAYKNAKKGKSHYKQVKQIESNSEYYLNQIQEMLLNKTFTTSEYIEKKIFDGKKKRIIHKLPFFPDRIIHHALIQIIEPILINCLIRDTFQSIKGRGISDARKRVSKYFKNNNPTYCLKIDFKKYYPSIDNENLKNKIRRKIKDKDVLYLIDDIIDSCKGLPIGNYTSQHFGNFYLSDLDHYIKEHLRIKGYFRYCDDLVILSDSKKHLWKIKDIIENFIISEKLNITWNIFNLRQKLDFVGYCYTQNKITLRTSIKRNFIKAKRLNNNISLISYWGWIKPINALTLWRLKC